MSATTNCRLGGAVNSPIILAQSAVPVIVAPNATWNNTTGSFTLGTALLATYSAIGAWVRFAGVGVNGSTGGPASSSIYWCVFSSTTAGQAYALSADTSQPFTPYYPGTGLSNLTTTTGTHVQTTGATITLANIAVPGGSMGPNGGLRGTSRFLSNNTAGIKYTYHYLNGSVAGVGNLVTTTGGAFIVTGRNRGVQNLQSWPYFGSDTAGTGGVTMGAIDTSLTQQFTFAAGMVTATDWIMLDTCMLEVLPS